MMFRVGQKVVCVMLMEDQGGGEEAVKFIHNRPVMNGIYTVRATCAAYSEQYLYLHELRNRDSWVWSEIGRREPPFWCGLFRPLVDRKTDIEFAYEILRKASKKIPALANSPAVRASQTESSNHD